MQNAVAFRPDLSSSRFVFSHTPAAQKCSHPVLSGPCSDHQFIALLDAYRDSGGLAPAQEVAALFRRHSDCDPATLTNLIVNNRVICFRWEATLWLPLFQFSPINMVPQTGLTDILTELSTHFDAWQVANWFTQSNARIEGRTPAAMLAIDPATVLNASRCQ